MRTRNLLVPMLLALALLHVPASGQSSMEAQTLVDGGFAVAVDVLEDGTIVYGELGGEVNVLHPDGTAELVYTVPTMKGPEWGLTGIAAAPDFNETGAIYVLYAWGAKGADPTKDDVEGEMRLVKIVDGSEEEVYTYKAVRSHNGGRVYLFDDHLFVTTGDTKREQVAQDPSNVYGKVLRMTLDGGPAPGNPGVEGKQGWNPYVWSIGHRNPFGIAWDGTRQEMVVSSPGQYCCGEVYLVDKGDNHGWPECAGPCDSANPDYEDPVMSWEDAITPIGAAAVGGDLYIGAYTNNGSIYRIHQDESGTWQDEILYEHGSGILDVERSPDGQFIYFGGWNGLHRLPTPEASLAEVEDEVWTDAPGEDEDNQGDESDDEPPVRANEPPEQPTPAAPWLAVALLGLVAALVARRC